MESNVTGFMRIPPGHDAEAARQIQRLSANNEPFVAHGSSDRGWLIHDPTEPCILCPIAEDPVTFTHVTEDDNHGR